jgi:acetyl esterase/lipase
VPRGTGPFPVAAVLHGGYWGAAYGKLTTRPVCLDLARRGWAAWNVEYRRLGRGQGGGWPATFDDVGGAIDHLAALDDPRLDLGRVVLVGHSAGGQLALWAAGRRDPVVPAHAVAALAPVTDLARAGAQARLLLGGTPDDVPERYAEADPVRRAPLDVPVLLVHPADDALVPVRRSRVYAELARARGGDVELVEPPAGGHRAPIDPSHPAWHAAAGWLAGPDPLRRAA